MASSETFKPGLFDIGFDIDKRLSKTYLTTTINRCNRLLEVQPIYLKPAISNLKAVLLFHKDSAGTDARLMFENLIEEYPNDLNILADLIHVYQYMGREKKSNTYKKKLALLKDDLLLQAKSILGQAFALAFDMTGNISPTVLLKDCFRILNMTDNNLEHFRKATDSVIESHKLTNTIPGTPYDTLHQHIDVLEIAVERFKKGIQTLENLNCSQEEILIWKHNLSRPIYILDLSRKLRGDDHGVCSANRILALQYQLDVIENLSQFGPLSDYVAESCILFVNCYLSWRDYIDNAHLPERIKNRDLNSMYHLAMSLCPNNIFILVMRGKYLCDKKRYLEALELYDKSIYLCRDVDINYATYALRSLANLACAGIDKDQMNTYLKRAYDDMKLCLESTCAETYLMGMCMLEMAHICCMRAMPDDESSMSYHCQNLAYMDEAVETLNNALNKYGLTKEYSIYEYLGVIYPYIGEYRKGIESMRTALELKKWSEDVSKDVSDVSDMFGQLFKCFLAFYKSENDRNLLSEFRSMLKKAKKIHLDKCVTDAIDKMHQYNPEMLYDLVHNMIEWDVRGCEMLIKEMLNKSDQNPPESARIYQNLREWVRDTIYMIRQCNNPGLLTIGEWYVKGWAVFIEEALKQYFNQNLPESTRIYQNLREWVRDTMHMIRQHNDPGLVTIEEWYVKGWAVFIEEALKRYFESIRISPNLRKQFETKLQQTRNLAYDTNGPREIQQSNSTETFQFDVFVLHSDSIDDTDWVHNTLRLRLEGIDKKIPFRCFIPDRDLGPGQKIDSMIKEIKQSHRILMVLTPNYLEDDFLNYVTNTLFHSGTESKKIIPIILEECEIPLKLKAFHPISFTKINDWEQLLSRLTVNIDSKTRVEER